jgi:DNA-3-methyladenine glycosylase II
VTPATVKALAGLDERLAEAIRIVGPCTLKPGRGSPYEALLSAIAHQQLHGKAAQSILARLRLLYPDNRYPTPEQLLGTADEDLRGVGLSRAKLLAMKDVAARTLDGTVPDRRRIQRLDNEAIIDRLTAARGVGRWTVEMILMFTLNRPDVLPVDDFGIREGFRLLHRKRVQPKPRWLEGYGERWAPYRTTASWYLWRYVDLMRAERRTG